MNAEYVGPYDVAPRGHPNDGRVETFLIDASMPFRQRLAVRRRLRNATHLPHPMIATRPVRSGDWNFDNEMAVRIDGVAAGRARRVRIDVEPDAATLYA